MQLSYSAKTAFLFFGALLFAPPLARAQEAEPLPDKRDTTAKYTTTIAGEFTPATGFDLIKTKRGSLNVSMYGLFRYINQSPQGQTFTDHLGRVRAVNP